MTHEEIEKVAVELGNLLSYEDYYVGCGYPAIEKAVAILTTYRAQVLEDVKDIVSNSRTIDEELGQGQKETLARHQVIQDLIKHPTN